MIDARKLRRSGIRARFYTSGVDQTADDVRAALGERTDPDDAVQLARFFRTAPGEYGAGDLFWGVRVPATRQVVRIFRGLALDEVDALLDDPVHECRLAGVLILVAQYPRTPEVVAERYLAAVRRGRVNNWDLVDASAEFILGPWLFDRDRALLDELAASASLWERRVAVLATFDFIKRGDASTTLHLAERLLADREDLIQKAVGWMLREVGKRLDVDLLRAFLDQHAGAMPRTMLSYATEHLTADERARYRAVPRITRDPDH